MNRELVLVGCAAALVVLAMVAALTLPGVIADPASQNGQYDRPGDVQIAEITIADGDVSPGTVTLDIDTYLVHRGNPVENATVVHRATNAETGLVETSRELAIDPLDDESERRVAGSISVPRDGEYHIESILYVDDNRVESSSRTVSGLETLLPPAAESTVEFDRSIAQDGGPTSLPTIEYRIVESDDGLVTMDVTSYLTNVGDDAVTGLELELTARQSDSHVVASTTTVDVGTIGQGVTATPSATLEVPEGYDYFLDATLRVDGTVVGMDRAPANLGPGNLTVDDSDPSTGIEVSDFERTTDRDLSDDEPDAGSDATPGFGLAIAVVATLLVVGALTISDRRREP